MCEWWMNFPDADYIRISGGTEKAADTAQQAEAM